MGAPRNVHHDAANAMNVQAILQDSPEPATKINEAVAILDSMGPAAEVFESNLFGPIHHSLLEMQKGRFGYWAMVVGWRLMGNPLRAVAYAEMPTSFYLWPLHDETHTTESMLKEIMEALVDSVVDKLVDLGFKALERKAPPLQATPSTLRISFCSSLGGLFAHSFGQKPHARSERQGLGGECLV